MWQSICKTLGSLPRISEINKEQNMNFYKMALSSLGRRGLWLLSDGQVRKEYLGLGHMSLIAAQGRTL